VIIVRKLLREFSSGDMYGRKKVKSQQNVNKKDQRNGAIKMDLWEAAPIDPAYLNPANGFAGRRVWLPGQDSNLQPTG